MECKDFDIQKIQLDSVFTQMHSWRNGKTIQNGRFWITDYHYQSQRHNCTCAKGSLGFIYWLVDFKNNSSSFVYNSRAFRENSLFRIFMSDTFLAHYYKVRKKYISGNSRRVVLKLLFNEGTFLVPVWIIMKRNKLEHVALYLKVI